MNKPKKDVIGKPVGFILILVLFILYLISDQDEYPKQIDVFAKHLSGDIDALQRQNKVLYEIIDNLLLDKLNKNEALEKLCTGITEDSISSVELARGYDCLANIEKNRTDSAAIYRAIRNESYALEANYDEKYQNNLWSIIFKGYEDKIQLDREELSVLNQLTESSNPELKSRAMYRLSLINSLGRASSLGDYNYNLQEASMLRNKILDEVKFPRKKLINIAFSLNNSPKYIRYAKTTIASILLNADLDSYYNFYVIMDSEDPINEQNKQALMGLSGIGPYSIEFKVIPKEIFNNKEGFDDIKTRLLFSRFLLENLLAELDSIITLDVDIIVLRDLYKLQYQRDLESYLMAGVIEGKDSLDKSLCQFSHNYINAGITVENLKLMRQIGSTDLILNKYQEIQNTKNFRCLRLLDQDVVNIFGENKILFLSKRWNYIPVLGFSGKSMPFIIHYASLKGSNYDEFYNQTSMKHLNLINMKYQEFADGFAKFKE